jgi:thiol-disulfide isomerase/thioredoxin
MRGPDAPEPTVIRPLLSAFLSAIPLAAQNPDLQKAEQELLHVFDRPSGQTIGDEQKANLAAFLKHYEGQDLGPLSYARALQLYLDQDYDGAAASLDEYLKRFPTIANADHRTMAGRIYLNALGRAVNAPAPDANKIAHLAENTTRLYGDTDLVLRLYQPMSARVKDLPAFRVALARGVFQSELATDKKDAFLRELYADAATAAGKGAAAATAPHTEKTTAPLEVKTAPAVPRTLSDTGPGASKVVQKGQIVETFATEAVLNGPDKFDLADYRGKVLLLDFFATASPPCRTAIPGLVELHKAHPDDLRIVLVTRLFGHGMDFSDPGASTPHGGKDVKDLDKRAELALDKAFLAAFRLTWPLVIAENTVARERFGITGIPAMFVIGKDGKLAGSVVGDDDEHHKLLVEMVTQALK